MAIHAIALLSGNRVCSGSSSTDLVAIKLTLQRKARSKAYVRIGSNSVVVMYHSSITLQASGYEHVCAEQMASFPLLRWTLQRKPKSKASTCAIGSYSVAAMYHTSITLQARGYIQVCA